MKKIFILTLVYYDYYRFSSNIGAYSSIELAILEINKLNKINYEDFNYCTYKHSWHKSLDKKEITHYQIQPFNIIKKNN